MWIKEITGQDAKNTLANPITNASALMIDIRSGLGTELFACELPKPKVPPNNLLRHVW
jgi:hypothetical protein